MLSHVDLILEESFQICHKSDFRQKPDRPFWRIVVVLTNPAAVVHGKFVMIVMVSFSSSQKRRDDIVARRFAIGVSLVAEVVSDGVDEVGALLHPEHTQATGVKQSAPPIVPECTSDYGRQ